MGFLAPAALALALLLPIIVAMYLLRLRRSERVVSSTYLWQQLVRDVEANAPWQRLRRNLLLILQLLFLASLVLALARPFAWSEGPAGQALILAVDTSASMAAIDAAPSRLDAARAEARRLVDGLPADARVTLIAAGEAPEVRVASALDRQPVYRALDGLRAGTGSSDLAAALELASALAGGRSGVEEPGTDIVVLSDGRVELPSRVAVRGRVRYRPVGSSGENQAIALLSLQDVPGEGLAATVQVANYGTAVAQRRLMLYADGGLVDAYDLEIPAGGRQAVVAQGLPAAAAVVEAWLEGSETEGDILPLDDRAWAVHRQADPAPATLVTPGNLFLETALALLPGLEVTVVGPDDWEQAQTAQDAAPALTILDGHVPVTVTVPAGSLLFIAPPRSSDYFSVTGSVEQPLTRLVDGDDPLLANLDAALPSSSGGIGVMEAVRIPLPAWARPIIEGDVGGETVPLLFAGEPGGRRVVVLAFDLHRSDLPLQVAFPLLLSNLAGWLAPTGGLDLPAQVAPGSAVGLALPPDVAEATLTRPDGSTLRLVPEGGRALLDDTAALGPYRLSWAGQEQAGFAVNLFAPLESDLKPAETLPLPGLDAEGAKGAEAQRAQREWWRHLAWLALILLLAEWLVYHRAALVTLRQKLPWARAGLGLVLPLGFLRPHVLWLLLLLPLAVLLALLARQRGARDRRFWAGLGLRCLLLTLLALSLAGVQLRRQADVLTTVFVLDASDSIPATEQARGEELVRQAIAAMPESDRAAVVVFGQDALVERLASGDRSLPALASVPVTARTDVAGALQLAMALFPDEGARRLVLLSDGRENVGRALAQAELAAARDVALSYVPLGAPGGEVEVRLVALEAPAGVRQGESFDLLVEVESTARVGGMLRVLESGRPFHSQEVRLQPGTNRFLVPAPAGAGDPAAAGDAAGFRRFRAQVVPDADGWLQNNEAGAFTVVHGPPRVLVVEGAPGEGADAVAALRAAEISVATRPPGEMPGTVAGLAAYDAVVLANVPAAALPAGSMEALQAYVRDLGRGLVTVGGDEAYGAGGYQRTALEETLPVDMEVRSREQEPNLALVLAVDKSGSMGRCHCDNPDLDQSY
ncbi:MAG: VWA domain-containing protein, partial [Anaerolineae bacterium]